ncbi:uncharacterized protein METZ01_LOCUS440941, partial [marine metagenome]
MTGPIGELPQKNLQAQPMASSAFYRPDYQFVFLASDSIP